MCALRDIQDNRRPSEAAGSLEVAPVFIEGPTASYLSKVDREAGVRLLTSEETHLKQDREMKA